MRRPNRIALFYIGLTVTYIAFGGALALKDEIVECRAEKKRLKEDIQKLQEEVEYAVHQELYDTKFEIVVRRYADE